MKNTVLDDIKGYAIAKLNSAYGYCGLADSDDKAFLCDLVLWIGAKIASQQE